MSINWLHNFEQARTTARTEKKLILLDFFNPN